MWAILAWQSQLCLLQVDLLCSHSCCAHDRHSVQKSEASASSLQRLSMGSCESPKATSGEESLADRLSRGSGGWSLLPNPARLLDTCRWVLPFFPT